MVETSEPVSVDQSALSVRLTDQSQVSVVTGEESASGGSGEAATIDISEKQTQGSHTQGGHTQGGHTPPQRLPVPSHPLPHPHVR